MFYANIKYIYCSLGRLAFQKKRKNIYYTNLPHFALQIKGFRDQCSNACFRFY